MDEGTAKCEENARYSFLLGSALRSEDTEQFLQVYDAVVPKDLPSEQVGTIKELARKIAELPESDFNALKTLKNLPNLASVTPTSGMSAEPAGNKQIPATLEDDLGAVQTSTPARPAKTSPGPRGASGKGCGVEGMSEEHVEDMDDQSDSGVFNSSKNTTGSTSDDTEMADEYGSRGVFNYFPPQRSQMSASLTRTMDNIEQRQRNDRAYDDAEVVVDSDGDGGELTEVVVDKGVDPTIKGAIEMKTFRMEATAISDPEQDKIMENLYRKQQNALTQSLNNLQCDEAVPVEDDDDDDNEVTFHQGQHGRKVGRFASMQREDSEDYEAESPEGPNMTLNRRLRSSYHRPQASDGVRIEQDVRQRIGPPFGDPVNMDKLSKSTERLMRFNPPSSQDVKNMPPAERIRNCGAGEKGQDSEGNSTETASKKKKKKKKNNKDESDDANRNQKDSSVDINGNPMMERSTASSSLASTTRLSSSSPLSHFSSFPKSTEQLSRMEMNGQLVADLEDLSNNSSKAERDQQKQSRATRRRNREAAQMIRSDDIEGFRGDTATIEDLLDFIESSGGSGNNKKKKKVGSSSGGGVVNGNSDSILPNGHETNDIMALTKNAKKVKQSGGKNKAGSSQKAQDSEKSSEDTSEKADDSSSGKSESDDVKEVVDMVGESGKKKVVEDKAEVKATGPDVQAKAPVTTNTSLQEFSSISLDGNDDFIFTDFENVQPLSEGEFKVVTRKKAPRSQPPPFFMGAHQKDYSRDSGYQYGQVYGGYAGPLFGSKDDRCFRPEDRPAMRRSRPIVRSVTPPPGATTPSAEKDHYYYPDKPAGERAFSPSAFPALGGMRRNSTGDVPSAIEPDDSDLESVKSLPLVAGSASLGARAEGNLSPIMSYAKIAAGPKTANAKSNQGSAYGVLAAWTNDMKTESDQLPETGRRHSLPSLTDPVEEQVVSEKPCADLPPSSFAATPNTRIVCDAKQHTHLAETDPEGETTPNPKTEQIIGNLVGTAKEAARTNETAEEETRQSQSQSQQQHLQTSRSDSDISHPKDVVTIIPSDSSVKKTQSDHKGESARGSNQPECRTPMLTFGSNVNSDLQGAILPILDQKEFPAITEVAAVTRPVVATSSQPSKALAPVAVASVPVTMPRTSAKPKASAAAPSTSTSVPATPTAPTASPSGTATNNKKQKNKSVVFLDRRSRRSTPNLGISFGFDTKLETAAAPVTAVSGAGTAPTPTSTTTSLTSSAVVSTLAQTLATAGAEVKKAECGFNGLVAVPTSLPAKLPVNVSSANTENKAVPPPSNNSTQELITPTPAGEPSAVIQSSCCPPLPLGAGATQQAVGMVAPTLNKDSTKRVVNIDKLMPPADSDPNFSKGRFNVEEAARALKEHWDATMDKKSKFPEKVKYYQNL